jgi:hypothetical protein
MYVTDNLVKIDFNPEMETGQEISNKNAAGNLCVVWRSPDLMKRLTLSLDVCVPDPELEVLLTGGELFTTGVDPDQVVNGFAYPSLMVDPTPNGVSIEAWTRYVVNGYQPPEQPYMWWVWPRAYLRKGNRTIDVNAMESHYEGFAGENPSWGTGPDQAWNWLSGRVLAVAFTNTVPEVKCGGQKVPTPSIVYSTGADAGIPGTWTPIGSTSPATVADLVAGTPNVVVANPTTPWAPGEYVQTQAAGAPGQAYWNGSAWVAGTAP